MGIVRTTPIRRRRGSVRYSSQVINKANSSPYRMTPYDKGRYHA